MTGTGAPSIVFGTTIDYQLRYHDGLYQRLADSGWDVHVVAGPGEIGERLAAHPSVTSHVLGMARSPRPFADLRALRAWIRLLRTQRPDVLVVGTPKAALLGALAGRLVGVPARVYELHGLRLESASGVARRMLRAMERLTCLASTAVVAVGPSLRERAIAEGLAPADRIDVIGAGSPNGVDVAHFADAARDTASRAALRADWGVPEGIPVVAFVGRLTADKGLGALADAMAGVSERTGAALVVVGGVDDVSGAEAADLLQRSAHRVVRVGEVDDVAPYLAASDVLCLPSRREGLPTVVLEAFAAGVPVVATAATGIVDLVVDGETGRLAPIDDAAALERQLIDALLDEDSSRRMARAAAERVATRFAQTTVQSAWLDTVERMRTSGPR